MVRERPWSRKHGYRDSLLPHHLELHDVGRALDHLPELHIPELPRHAGVVVLRQGMGIQSSALCIQSSVLWGTRIG